ncbi:MAG: anaerobic ribonucleoside-triphosphate reductase [Oscillospiraceae bacterium]|jgi:anaerobic ribonucleoside-triphosphate reductase|nr:anaerobic ribonucleoside-triphosphate reductase [Oscillibacter sp.]MDR3989673.1 anaerobic ribonucleoside-triphosphate reductase [Oscillospiraceae bacterium]CDB27147.1 anaerobic ribonucleoside-triphosphate reductase [Oscillibacter sp. CAG:241]HCR06070.1 anaerobic ribonucleoside-triphosphate reductase [Oscillibacter sp.]
MKIIKRNGAEVAFDIQKIERAITKANNSVTEADRMTPVQIGRIAESVELQCQKMNRAPTVEEIQDMVEHHIMAHGAFEVAKHYITYRYTRSLVRRANTTDDKILSLIECNNEEAKQENSNKNPVVNSTQRDYMAGEVSRDITNRLLLPQDIVEAHEEGIIHFHDTDYFAQHMHNCDLVNLEDMLQNGTVITGTMIEKPHSFATACNIATQIVAQVASNQYGGQSISLTHLAPFVEVSRQKIRRIVLAEMASIGVDPGEEKIHELVEARLREEIRRGVQTIQYQVVTLLTTNGQAPFITVFMYLNEARDEREKKDLAMIIEEMLLQRYQGVKNEQGVWVTPAFPKLIYTLEEDNIHEDSPYWYLTELAAKCTARRMVPDYISEKKMKELKGDVYTCMGCRSFLTPDRFTDAGIGNVANAGNYEPGKHKYYGRFNQGVVTINLPDVALSSGGNMDRFWQIFEERLELCHRALRCRHERLLGTTSDAAPILWQYGALARLKKGETIDKLLYNGYSTISLGYAGLYECVKYMTGKSHTDPAATPFALDIMQKMNDKCKEWKTAENIDYSLYGTPLESTTYKFAKCLQKRFGVIKGITDKGYITNSYHVNVTEEIDAFTKLEFEAQFQHLSPGGAISYVEVPDMQNNIPAVLEVMKFIYDHIIYAELNTKSDYCQVCGWDGEIQIVEEDGKLIWKCPQCGNTDQDKMNVARRTCGYIGTQFWNQGRTQEIKDRVLHL